MHPGCRKEPAHYTSADALFRTFKLMCQEVGGEEKTLGQEKQLIKKAEESSQQD